MKGLDCNLVRESIVSDVGGSSPERPTHKNYLKRKLYNWNYAKLTALLLWTHNFPGRRWKSYPSSGKEFSIQGGKRRWKCPGIHNFRKSTDRIMIDRIWPVGRLTGNKRKPVAADAVVWRYWPDGVFKFRNSRTSDSLPTEDSNCDLAIELAHSALRPDEETSGLREAVSRNPELEDSELKERLEARMELRRSKRLMFRFYHPKGKSTNNRAAVEVQHSQSVVHPSRGSNTTKGTINIPKRWMNNMITLFSTNWN